MGGSFDLFGLEEKSKKIGEGMGEMVEIIANFSLPSFFVYDLYKGIKYTINQEIIENISSFYMSDNYIRCYLIEDILIDHKKKNNKIKDIFNNIITQFICVFCESNSKYLIIKILFPLIDRLKELNFQNQLIKINKIDFGDKNIKKKFFDDKIKKELEDYSEPGKIMEIFECITEFHIDNSYFEILSTSFKLIFDIEKLLKEKKIEDIIKSFVENILSFISSIEEKDRSIQIKGLINYLKNLDSLKYTENLCQIFLGILNMYSIKSIYNSFLKDKGNKYIEFINLLSNINLRENYLWYIFGESSNEADNISIFHGKKFVKEKFSIDFFEPTYTEEKNYLKGFICKSLFSNNEIIIIILNLDKYDKKICFTELSDEINNIQKHNNNDNTESKHLKSYIIYNNALIPFNNSYEKFIKDLLDHKIFVNDESIDAIFSKTIANKKFVEPDNIEIDDNKVIDKNKNTEENKFEKNEVNNRIVEVNKIREFKELDENKEVRENYEYIINELKQKNEQLLLDKKNLIKNVNDLEKALEAKDKELKESIEKQKNQKKDLIDFNTYKFDSKEDLFKIILQKDKEINDLKIKLSRFPFELNEGEKLMTINFISVNQEINYSIICKNTQRFNEIENKLYDVYPKYSENENYFIVRGQRVIKNKTLEENHIENNDVIILNHFQENMD